MQLDGGDVPANDRFFHQFFAKRTQQLDMAARKRAKRAKPEPEEEEAAAVESGGAMEEEVGTVTVLYLASVLCVRLAYLTGSGIRVGI